MLLSRQAHGGPTSTTNTIYRTDIQYWTTRGFAVLDVQYRGSCGYGREYRLMLAQRHGWGVMDVQDVCHGAQHLVDAGLVDGDKVCIDGGSAGGYTSLGALSMHDMDHDVFKAACSRYGIGDITLLARDTHKFESRYIDNLIGPWPAAKELYEQRSPVNHIDRLKCPVLLLQGSEDKVVPPNQAEAMFDALKAKGIPAAYVLFPGEGHGFRAAKHIERSLNAELYFYSRIFGFDFDQAYEDPAADAAAGPYLDIIGL